MGTYGYLLEVLSIVTRVFWDISWGTFVLGKYGGSFAKVFQAEAAKVGGTLLLEEVHASKQPLIALHEADA